MTKFAYQDGPDFYATEGGHIVSYPEMVSNDYDVDGATQAAQRFQREFPGYQLEGEE